MPTAWDIFSFGQTNNMNTLRPIQIFRPAPGKTDQR